MELMELMEAKKGFETFEEISMDVAAWQRSHT